MPQHNAEKVSAILIKDSTGTPVGIVIRNGHRIFYSIQEMGDDEIMQLINERPIYE